MALDAELINLKSAGTYRFERELREVGYSLIGGVDEVGRGPLVGPVVAACCVLPKDFHLEGLTDSKKLTKKRIGKKAFKGISADAIVEVPKGKKEIYHHQ